MISLSPKDDLLELMDIMLEQTQIINRASCVKNARQDENIFTWKLSKYIIIIKVKEMERRKTKTKNPVWEDSMTQRVSGEVSYVYKICFCYSLP